MNKNVCCNLASAEMLINLNQSLQWHGQWSAYCWIQHWHTAPVYRTVQLSYTGMVGCLQCVCNYWRQISVYSLNILITGLQFFIQSRNTEEADNFYCIHIHTQAITCSTQHVTWVIKIIIFGPGQKLGRPAGPDFRQDLKQPTINVIAKGPLLRLQLNKMQLYTYAIRLSQVVYLCI